MSRVPALRLCLAVALGAPLATTALPPSAAQAAADDPAAMKIASFDDALIQAMKAGRAAGAQARFKIMAPAVDAAFDIPTMTRLVTGPAWATTSAADRATMISAFRRYTIASYAKNFSGYDGQKLVIDPDILVRGLDKVVRTQMTGAGSDATLSYRMRQIGGSWKAIDILYNGSISQLTVQRSDFAATVADGGAKALADKLDAQANRLLK